MKILGEIIELSNDYIDIRELKFLKENPRVYSCTHGESNFDKIPEEKQQQIIYEKLLEEPSVKKLMPEIKRHGGLMESILIRHDTMEVIEGNSRLAVYLKLHKEKSGDEEWESIPCNIVSNLTDRQQAAFLNQIHVKGKTQWSAYEKANFAYVRKEKGSIINEIANLFGESTQTIRTRIKSIELMKKNKDNERSHFSFYDVLVRDNDTSKAIDRGGLRRVLKDIKNLGSDEDSDDFTAQDLRKKLPVVLKKPKVLKKYQDGKLDLDEAYQFASISHVEDKLKRAMALLMEVDKTDILALESDRLNAFKQVSRKLSRETKRITYITDMASRR